MYSRQYSTRNMAFIIYNIFGESKMKKILIMLIILFLSCMGMNLYAHSGRTDANGGHRDNKNVSGLGPYHYHCGGHPAHLHTNGVCPYSSNVGTSSKSDTTSTVPTTVSPTKIKINEDIKSIKVGESKNLTATIEPSNATDRSISWKSSNESIATISSAGQLVAKKSGVITVTASTSNGKTNTIMIDVRERKEDIVKASTNSTTNTNTISDINSVGKTKEINPLVVIMTLLLGNMTLGILGVGGYLGYKKLKKGK